MGESKTSRIAALAGLRGIAAASVVLFHVWHYGGPGATSLSLGYLDRVMPLLDFGVTFFFVLSAFLLYRPYAKALLGRSPLPSLRDFALARFLRIVPLYWLAVLIVAALIERQLLEQPQRLLANLLFVQFLFPDFLPPDLGQSNGSIAIVPSWALVVEVGFYITLPLVSAVAWAVARSTERRVVAAFLPAAVLSVIGIVGIAIEHSLEGDARRAWSFNFPMHAGAFACGLLGATLWVLSEQGKLQLSVRARMAASLLAVAVALPATKLYNQGQLTQNDTRWAIAFSLSLLLLVVVLSPANGRVHSLLGTRGLVAVGLASYSVFLAHDPLIRVLRSQEVARSGAGGFWLMLFLTTIGTGVLAFGTYRAVEKPSLALKKRLIKGQPQQRITSVMERARQLSELPGFEVDLSDAAECVDPAALSAIVNPLIDNALAYGGPPYTIRASVTDGTLFVTVEDSGRGIDEHFIPRLFEPHTRSETSSERPGSGLGLAKALELSRRLGGDLIFEPPPRQGARFVVILPAQQASRCMASGTGSVARPAHRSLGSPRVSQSAAAA